MKKISALLPILLLVLLLLPLSTASASALPEPASADSVSASVEETTEETSAETEDYTAAPHLENIVADTDALLMLRNAEGRLDKVTDIAHLLGDDEIDELTSLADYIENSYGITVYTLTLNDYTLYTGSDIFTLAEDIYDFYALGSGTDGDGMLLVLSMADRDYTLIAHGAKANYYFTDYGRHQVSDAFLPYFADDDWYGGFCSYYDSAERVIIAGESGTPIDDPVIDHNSAEYRRSMMRERLGASAIAGLIISIITCVIFRAGMKSAKLKKEAGNYIADNGIRITKRNTIFLHANETRTRIENNSTRGGGGGTSINSRGFSGHSGKF